MALRFQSVDGRMATWYEKQVAAIRRDDFKTEILVHIGTWVGSEKFWWIPVPESASVEVDFSPLDPEMESKTLVEWDAYVEKRPNFNSEPGFTYLEKWTGSKYNPKNW